MSKIYKITNPSVPGVSYIGSTKCSLKKRLSEHKCNSIKQGRTKTLVPLFSAGTPSIELLQECTDAQRWELERFHMNMHGFGSANTLLLNKRIPAALF